MYPITTNMGLSVHVTKAVHALLFHTKLYIDASLQYQPQDDQYKRAYKRLVSFLGADHASCAIAFYYILHDRHIMAVKHVRVYLGCGLKEAKAVIDAARETAYQGNLPVGRSATPDHLDENTPQEVHDYRDHLVRLVNRHAHTIPEAVDNRDGE